MDAKSLSAADLVAAGIERHEVKWLFEEYGANERPELSRAIARRVAGEPLQYILGHWPFRNLDLLVDPRALIPRPETEELVTRALSEVRRQQLGGVKIMDLGCGTGAIGLSLVQELSIDGIKTELISVDLSGEALALARENGDRHHLSKVEFIQSSWFESVDPNYLGTFNLITANPPYVGETEFATLDPILRHEPLMAIVSPTDNEVPGFKDLAEIIAEAPRWLSANGILVCEHADIHREAVLAAAHQAGFAEAEDFDDLAGKPRTLIARMS